MYAYFTDLKALGEDMWCQLTLCNCMQEQYLSGGLDVRLSSKQNDCRDVSINSNLAHCSV